MPKKVVKSEPTPAPAPTETVPVVVPVVPEVVKEDDLTSAYSEVTAKLSSVRQQMSSLILEFKTLQKRAERELKAVQKSSNKRKQRNATRAPSGFVPQVFTAIQHASSISHCVSSRVFSSGAMASPPSQSLALRSLCCTARASSLQSSCTTT